MITEGLFNFLDTYPLWLQYIIALPIGVSLVGIITACLMGIKELFDWMVGMWYDGSTLRKVRDGLVPKKSRGFHDNRAVLLYWRGSLLLSGFRDNNC